MTVAASRANRLEKRLISLAAAIVSLSSKLPRTPQGRHSCGQILRSGTATAANYGEARGAESRADFIHKLKVVFKELNETTIWLEVIAQSSLCAQKSLPRLSRKTANSAELSPRPSRPLVVETMIPSGQSVIRLFDNFIKHRTANHRTVDI